MSMPKLLRILQPPIDPREIPTEKDWAFFEHKWHQIPAEFKHFVNSYGTGSIDGFIWLFNPSTSNQFLNANSQVPDQLATLEIGGDIGFPLFPAPGGFLPFGGTDNGDILGWLTKGTTAQWSVVIQEGRSSRFEEYHLDFATFLYQLLKKDIVSKIFPDDFPSGDIKFTSAG